MPDRFVRYAVKSASYLVLHAVDSLTRARRLVASAPLTTDDGGDGGDFIIGVSAATSADRGVVKLTGQLGGTADLPDVRGVRIISGDEGEGPQLLAFGGVKDGDALVRSDDTIVGTAVVRLADGALAGNLAAGGHRLTGLASGVEAGDAATYGQVSSMLSGLDWQQSVIDRDLAEPPASPELKDRYLVAVSATGDWSSQSDKIAEWNGTDWVFTTPNSGFTVHVDDEGRDLYFNGTAWVNIGASVDHNSLLNLETGNPHTQYQLGSAKDANGGYAALDDSGLVNRPVKAIRTGDGPVSPTSGEVWIDGAALMYRDEQGTPATQTVERQANRNQASGYAGLNGDGRLDAAQAPVKGTYTSGGQAIAPSDIGAVPSSRMTSTGAGLSGGGDLSVNRTIAIASFTGLVSKEFGSADPEDWTTAEMKVHGIIDVGGAGQLLPMAVRLPPTISSGLRNQVAFELDNTNVVFIVNTSDNTALDLSMQDMLNFLTGELSSSPANNGRCVQKIILRTFNNSGGAVTGVNLGLFKVRAWASPRGAGVGL